MFILKASRSLAACSREALRTNVRMIKQTTIIFNATNLDLNYYDGRATAAQ